MELEKAVDILKEEFSSSILNKFLKKIKEAAERTKTPGCFTMKHNKSGFQVYKDGKFYGNLPMNYFQGINGENARNKSLLDAFISKKDR